jgi:hypothetical protein
VDGEDVVQSVFRTFFRQLRGGDSPWTAPALWRLLVAITLNKVRARVRRHMAARRDVAARCGRSRMVAAPGSRAGAAEAAAPVDQIEARCAACRNCTATC